MRLLVVEDDRALADVMRRGLAEEGYAVDLVGSVAAADEAVAINSYDLMVLDLGLPDGDGGQFCRELRSRGESVPILMLTARAGTYDKVGGLDSGADDYLTKPFDFPELCARLRALARRPADAHPLVLEEGDTRLDPAAHQVTRSGMIVPLTSKEFAVLEMLMRRSGRVVTKAELLEGAWDSNYDGLSNVIEVNIASLRRKLESAGGPAPIETLRGVGYRYGDPA